MPEAFASIRSPAIWPGADVKIATWFIPQPGGFTDTQCSYRYLIYFQSAMVADSRIKSLFHKTSCHVYDDPIAKTVPQVWSFLQFFFSAINAR